MESANYRRRLYFLPQSTTSSNHNGSKLAIQGGVSWQEDTERDCRRRCGVESGIIGPIEGESFVDSFNGG